MEVTLQDKNYEGKSFYNNELVKALEDSQEDNFRPVFMNEFADLRIKADKQDELIKKWYLTPSLRATGITNQGSKVVVYAHTDNYFSNQKNVRKARKDLVNGAGKLPQEEFQKLVDQDKKENENKNRLVYVVDYEKLKKSSSKVIPVSQALEHPQTIPFLGGEERAKLYLEKHKEVYGNTIGIWHSNDLQDEAFGRLLYAGYGYYNGLSGDDDLDGIGRFFGVRPLVVVEKKIPPQETKPKEKQIKVPSLEEIIQVSRKFVPEIAQEKFKEELKKLYEN